MTYDEKVEAVAEILWQYYRKNRGRWHMENSMVQDVYRTKAHTLLELALGDVRTIAMRALEDDRDHKNELRSIIPMCSPAPPVEVDNVHDVLQDMWGLVCNVSGGNWEDQSPDWQKAASRIRDNYHQIMQIFAEVK